MTTETTGGTTAAATTTTATTTDTAGSATTPSAPDWTSGLNDDYKGFVSNKGFKAPADVLESYRNLEKLVGAPKERLLKLPENLDSPEMTEIFTRLGRPEKPEGYKVPTFEKMGDPEFGKTAAGMFHKAGLTAKQAEVVANELNAYVEGKVTAGLTDYNTKVESEHSALKKEWGAAYEQNAGVAKQAATALGIGPEKIEALEKVMGFAATVKFMHSLGEKLGESQYVGGGNKQTSFAVSTPAGARSRIAELGSDPEWTKKYLSGDKAALAEMTRLQQWAYPAESA